MMLSERAASATPGKVHIDDNVREMLERRAMSLRYPPKRSEQFHQNGTMPVPRPRHIYTSSTQLHHPVDVQERLPPIPPPSLVQNGVMDTLPSSSRRSEMSAIANQEDDRATARARPSPIEFYSRPENRFKSLPVTTKKNKSDGKDKNFAVKAYRWLKKTFRGSKKKRTNTPADSSQMEAPGQPPAYHVRSKSLPRNARFNNRSTRREPSNQQHSTPVLVRTGTLQRAPPLRSNDFPPHTQEPNQQTSRRTGVLHQSIGDRRSIALSEEEEKPAMPPLAMGFPNLGNTCYWNAILQALGACEPVAACYLNRDILGNRRINDLTTIEELSYFFGRVINCMWRNVEGGEYIKRLRAIFFRENNMFGNACQQDAQEFLICLVNKLSRDAMGNECWQNTTPAIGIDNGAFKNNLQGWVRHEMICPCTQSPHTDCKACGRGQEFSVTKEFTPFLTLAFPGQNDCLFNFITINGTSDYARMMRYSIHVNSDKGGVIRAKHLIAYETGISVSQLLLFQVNSSSFCQTLITEEDLKEYHLNSECPPMDKMYATQLEPVALRDGYEILTVLFIHTEADHEMGGMKRLTHPFKCTVPMNCTYAELVRAITTASGAIFHHPNEKSLLFANDILIVDDNDYEDRVLNRMVKHPFLNEHVARCITEQTRIYPYLPRYIRLVIRWKKANGIIIPQNDSVIRHASYIESRVGYPLNLRFMFHKYFSPEFVRDFTCAKCGHVGAIKTTRYVTIPNIIAISFNRFQQSKGAGFTFKINTPVAFPIENFDITPWVLEEKMSRDSLNKYIFDTVSVACHTGTADNGHYYAYSRGPISDFWRRYDDNLVRTVTPEEVDDGNAYLLFLQNRHNRLTRRPTILSMLRENSNLFTSLRFRKSRDSLHRIAVNGHSSEETPPPRHESLVPLINEFNRCDISRASRQTHL